MSEMIERMAASISDRRQLHRYGSVVTPWGDRTMADSFKREQIEIACAVIDVMREPTIEMILASDIRDDEYYITDPATFVTEIWQAMIDAAKSPAVREGKND